MASDKETMLRNANNYARYVAEAKLACQNAARSLNSPISTVSENWKGSSGEAMRSALEDLKSELDRLYGRLSSLESQMRSRANSIYNGWPEDEEIES